MTGLRSRILLIAAAIFTSLVIAALIGEAAIRYHDRNSSTVPGNLPFLYYPHKRLGYGLIHNSNHYRWAHINDQGFRGPDVTLVKRPGTLRIMAVGASTTFDTMVSGDEHTWPARLQYWLRTLAPAQPVEVINAGVPGYCTIDNLIRLQTELHRYQPDIIISYEVHNDFYKALAAGRNPPLTTNTPDEMPTITPWAHWLSRNSLLYMKIGVVWKFLSSHPSRGRPFTEQRVTEAIDHGAVEFEKDLSSFVAVARTLGIAVVLPEVTNVSGSGTLSESDPSILAVWQAIYPGMNPEPILRGYAQYNAVLRRVAGCERARYISTAGFGLRGVDLYAPYDPIHFNDRGASRMAENLARSLLANQILSNKFPPLTRGCENGEAKSQKAESEAAPPHR